MGPETADLFRELPRSDNCRDLAGCASITDCVIGLHEQMRTRGKATRAVERTDVVIVWTQARQATILFKRHKRLCAKWRVWNVSRCQLFVV